jgi:hypothetical protein
MSLRQYAAIHLRVPDSGTPWLDDMIRSSAGDEFAKAALQGLLANPKVTLSNRGFAINSYLLADAMLAERAKTKGGAS